MCIAGFVSNHFSISPAQTSRLPTMSFKPPTEIKTVLLGAVGVGKSSIVVQFVNNTFQPLIDSTIGASYQSKTIYVDSECVKFQIWDTAGAEKYHSLTPMYYRNAAAAIIVYSITNRATFDAAKVWIDEIRAMGSENTILALVGNKQDLEAQRQVASEEAEAIADDVGSLFLETSAKTSKGIYELFQRIAKAVPRRRADDELSDDSHIDGGPSDDDESSGCC
eukprot:gnl/Chilomastix_cuspidata/2136.p1 GENE.gnl/Chilomastix_cuspidata/2136~~gnl/Chilomastix_cuspidata/2136.p1  ORF type:complete len:222 (-),score=83.02 gnl/Chilomastix_cuspidata/2136:36-701(-)